MNPLDRLVSLAGHWTGTSRLSDPQFGIADESTSSAIIQPVLDGRFVRLDYNWAYRDTPQQGSILFGYEKAEATVTAHWIDSWHMSDKVMALRGPSGARISVKGTYAAPPGPDWGWRIVLEPDAAELRMVMFNITPDGQEELAVEAAYRRED